MAFIGIFCHINSRCVSQQVTTYTRKNMEVAIFIQRSRKELSGGKRYGYIECQEYKKYLPTYMLEFARNKLFLSIICHIYVRVPVRTYFMCAAKTELVST